MNYQYSMLFFHLDMFVIFLIFLLKKKNKQTKKKPLMSQWSTV